MTDTTDPTTLASLLSDRDDTIASLRALLKAKEHEIADLTRDRDRFEGRILFANAGSALRAPSPSNPRRHPCPTCYEPDCLTDEDKRIGYQCDVCADRAEGRGGYE